VYRYRQLLCHSNIIFYSSSGGQTPHSLDICRVWTTGDLQSEGRFHF